MTKGNFAFAAEVQTFLGPPSGIPNTVFMRFRVLGVRILGVLKGFSSPVLGVPIAQPPPMYSPFPKVTPEQDSPLRDIWLRAMERGVS